MALTTKQQVFVEEYLKHFNATKAAIDAGYSPKTAYNIGWENVRKREIADVISKRLAESAMSADEVLKRLADDARADLGPWLSNDGVINIQAMKRDGATHLIRKVKRTERTGETATGGTWNETRVELELHDAQAARKMIAHHHGLFKDVSESKIDVSADDETRSLLSRVNQLAARIRETEPANGTSTDAERAGTA
jgi:phage terminase small subunit